MLAWENVEVADDIGRSPSASGAAGRGAWLEAARKVQPDAGHGWKRPDALFRYWKKGQR